MPDTRVDVVVQIAGEDLLAGRLYSHRGRVESATFSYEEDYLASPQAYALDPALPLSAGQQQTLESAAIFGAFSDCAPDRWGRRLIDREENRRAKAEGAARRAFGEIDYLLGVRDDMRQGALRFRAPESGLYLADERHGVPHLIGLGELLSAIERLEREEADEEALRLLLRGGSSLGGARPKAHVINASGKPSIAKFPSANDDHSVIVWEAVALALARAAAITVPDWSLNTVDGTEILILERFDRDGSTRVGYLSAMTMLELRDREQGSYLEIADAIERESPTASADLSELWRRMAFTILVSNTDDHLRNHGFLRKSSAGWSLAPAFDLNPNPEPGIKELSTAIDLDDVRASISTLLAVGESSFGLGQDECREILGEVLGATAGWRQEAGRQGLDNAAIEQMEPAFEHAERDAAAKFVG